MALLRHLSLLTFVFSQSSWPAPLIDIKSVELSAAELLKSCSQRGK
jgi:hypothetical protein